MISSTRHLELFHSNRGLQQDIDRLLSNEISAASSFVDEKSKNNLIQAAIDANKSVIELWLKDAHRQHNLTLYHTFTARESMRLGCPNPHVGIIRDSKTGHIEIRATYTICVILNAVNDTYNLFNAYPAIIRPYGIPTGEDPKVYIRSSQVWKSAPPMKKAYFEAAISNTFGHISFDYGKTAVILDICEDDKTLGTVTVNNTMSSWTVWREPSVQLLREHGTTMLKRAFPETFEKVRLIWDFADGFTTKEVTVKPVAVTKTKPKAVPNETDAELEQTDIPVPEHTSDKREQARIARAKKKAQSRSKRNVKHRATQKAKPAQKNSPKRTVPKTIPFKPTRVKTRFEEDGIPQDLTNELVIADYIMHRICMLNKKRMELMTLVPENSGTTLAYVMTINDELVQEALDAIRDANKDVEAPDFTMANIIHEKILDGDKTLHPMRAKSTSWGKTIIKKIAQDADWQPLVPDELLDRVESKPKDKFGNQLTRVCKDHLNISLMTRHDLKERDIDDNTPNHSIVDDTPPKMPEIDPENPRESLRKLMNAGKQQPFPRISHTRISHTTLS